MIYVYNFDSMENDLVIKYNTVCNAYTKFLLSSETLWKKQP